MSVNQIRSNSNKDANILKTKEIDLQIICKERQERTNQKLNANFEKPMTINPSKKGKRPKLLRLFYFLLGLIYPKFNKIKDNSFEEGELSPIKFNSPYIDNPNIKIINVDSFTIKKTFARLYYSSKEFYSILFLNIFLPGVGTIVAAIGWGKTCKYGDRTKELICRGILQITTFFLIVPWIQAINDSSIYFEESLC